MSKDNEGATPEENATLEGLKAELEETKKQLLAVSSEAKDRRLETAQLRKEKEEREKANLSDVEKLQAEMAEWKRSANERDAQLRAERIRTAIITKASELGFSNPEHAYLLIQKETDIEVGADGIVSGFEKSLEALAESGSLKMNDQDKSAGLGTPRGKGKPTGDDHKEQAAPKIRL